MIILEIIYGVQPDDQCLTEKCAIPRSQTQKRFEVSSPGSFLEARERERERERERRQEKKQRNTSLKSSSSLDPKLRAVTHSVFSAIDLDPLRGS